MLQIKKLYIYPLINHNLPLKPEQNIMIEWQKLTNEDINLISKIVERFYTLNPSEKIPRLDIEMDISACHLITPLDLSKLLDFPVFDFQHDISGIYNNILRDSGRMKNHFSPRSSRGK